MAKNSIVSRLYGFVANHIQGRRSGTRLPLNVSLLEPAKTRAASAQHSPAVSGYLHDISKTGLSLVVPSVRFGNHYLIDCSDYILQIMVELPNEAVNIQATPVRFDKLDESQYFIGARIIQMTDLDRRRIVKYIKQAKKRRVAASETRFAHDAKSF